MFVHAQPLLSNKEYMTSSCLVWRQWYDLFALQWEVASLSNFYDTIAHLFAALVFFIRVNLTICNLQ